MPETLDLAHGASGLLTSICAILLVFLLLKVAEFLLKFREKKDSTTDIAIHELTAGLSRNTQEIHKLNVFFSEYPKMKLDVRRLYLAIKIVSGDKWPAIRKEIMDEDISQ